MTTAMPSETEAMDALRQVLDPEVNINIVDLGLVYSLAVSDHEISVAMTMTTPACPLGPLLTGQVETALAGIAPPDASIDVEVVWEPPWRPDMMSEMARVALGLA